MHLFSSVPMGDGCIKVRLANAYLSAFVLDVHLTRVVVITCISYI